MKKGLIFLMVVLAACGGKDDEVPAVNPMPATAWEVNDDIADIIWKGPNMMGYEFLSDTACQWYRIRSGKVSERESATYTFADDMVTVAFGDSLEVYDLKGSFLVSQTRIDPFNQEEKLTFIKKD